MCEMTVLIRLVMTGHYDFGATRGPGAGYGRRGSGGAAGARLLPKLLPCPWSATDARRQAWNIGPGDSHSWIVLDDLPKPTDQKAGGSSPSERARSTALHPLGSDLLANGFANSSASSRRYRPREDVGCFGDLLADHVSIDPQCDRRIGMA